MVPIKTLFLTDRSPHHQAAALAAAPPQLAITMLRRPAWVDLQDHLATTEILISERADRIDRAVIDAAPKLRLIQRLGSLTYDIDIEAAAERNIAVCYWPIQGCMLVAEHMVMQLLALSKRLLAVNQIAVAAADWQRPSLRTDENTFAYNWSRQRGIEGVAGEAVGILGFGEIGIEFVRRLQPFRPGIVRYHKRTRLPAAVEAALGIRYASTEEIVAESTFLCSLLPYSPDTDLLLNQATFAAMPQGSYLLSCGSGSVIDEKALAAALQTGHLAGAALDTYEYEPLRADNPLLALARQPEYNLVLTPHTAAGASSKSVKQRKRTMEYANILRFLQGEQLQYQVAPVGTQCQPQQERIG